MEIEQGSQLLSISKRGRQLQELPSVDRDEFSAPPQRGMNLRPLLRTVRRKALLVIGIAGVVTVGAWFLTKGAKASYEGDFRLLVEPVTNEARIADPSALTRSQGGAPVPGQDTPLDYPTQLEILRSPKMMGEIAEQVKARYPNFSAGELQTGLVVKRYESGKANAGDPTKMIQVTYQGLDPDQVQFVLEVTANKYLRYSLEERKSRIGEGVKFIEEQLPPLQKRVDALQSQRQRLQQQYKLTDPQVQGQELFTQIRTLATQQREAESQLQEQRMLYASLQKQLELTPDEAIAASALSEDPNYKTLQAKVQEIDNQLAVESGRFTSDSPTIQSLQAKRQNLLSLQGKETSRILGQGKVSTANNPQVQAFQNSVRLALINQMVAAANQAQQLEVRNQSLAQARNSLERQAQQFPTIARQYTELQQQLDMATKTRDQLLSQRETLRVEAAQKQVPWELVSKPEVPRDEDGKAIPAPSKAKNLQILGVVLGLLLGIVAAVLIEKFRNIFYSTEEIKEASQLPLLGVIPPYKISEQFPNATAYSGAIEGTEGSHFGSSQFQDAFDALYANIRFLYSDPPVRSLAVCSAAPGDGKTTVALHLAQSAASMGQRVLLVDANLRQPQLHAKLDLPNAKGLSDLLAKKLAPNELIQRSPLVDNLFVLTSGQPLPNSTKLLGSAQMQYLMEEFQATFDLVIYDTSHLLDRMDASFLAAHTDGLLMVVGVRKTNRSVVKQVLEQLNAFRLPSLGVVANHVRKDTNIPYGTLTTSDETTMGDELVVHPHV
jgi:capsular exopolysaccharide synthesis family protein